VTRSLEVRLRRLEAKRGPRPQVFVIDWLGPDGQACSAESLITSGEANGRDLFVFTGVPRSGAPSRRAGAFSGVAAPAHKATRPKWPGDG